MAFLNVFIRKGFKNVSFHKLGLKFFSKTSTPLNSQKLDRYLKLTVQKYPKTDSDLVVILISLIIVSSLVSKSTTLSFVGLYIPAAPILFLRFVISVVRISMSEGFSIFIVQLDN